METWGSCAPRCSWGSKDRMFTLERKRVFLENTKQRGLSPLREGGEEWSRARLEEDVQGKRREAGLRPAGISAVSLGCRSLREDLR